MESAFTCDAADLARFVSNSIFAVADYLRITPRFSFSSDIPKDGGLNGQQRILAICEAVGVEVYINAIGGMSLYDRDAFARRGIELKFVKTREVTYKQFGEFVPNLSIIDVMMFNSQDDISAMLDEFDLV